MDGIDVFLPVGVGCFPGSAAINSGASTIPAGVSWGVHSCVSLEYISRRFLASLTGGMVMPWRRKGKDQSAGEQFASLLRARVGRE